ncbi:hypothetical protein LJB91_02715 [Bacteroidales bacterium OttesenSCG-928-L03]|nr:hypothetical protein [Bacteroidales bacterium OttesenSCG-928-L03]
MKTRFFILCWMLCSVIATSAQTNNGLKLHMDFSLSENKNVSDPISGITAKVLNDAAIETMGDYKVLNLGNGSGYLDLTSDAGTLFRQSDTFSISVYYRVNFAANLSGNGFFLWSFSTSNAAGQTDGKYSAYRLNAQRFAASIGGYSNETAIQVGSASAKDRWVHVVYTETAGNGQLYIDGKLIGSNTSMHKNSTNFGSAAVPYCWIGRPPFSADQYLKRTLVYDFRLYDRVLSTDEIAAFTEENTNLDEAFDSTQQPSDRKFNHPGGLLSNKEIEVMKRHIEAKEQPWYGEWLSLVSAYGVANYTSTGGTEIGGSDGNRQRACRDAKAAFYNAVIWRVRGTTANADCAARILSAWGNTCTSAKEQLFQFPCLDMVTAAEMLRNEDGTFYEGWKEADRTKFMDMVRNVFYPACLSECTNGMSSWSAPAYAAVTGMGILLDNEAIYKIGIGFFKGEEDVSGSIYNALLENGQVVEMGRDNVHAMLTLGDMAQTAQMAWNQGDNLFAEGDYRMVKGFDYWCCYNSGHDTLYYKPVPSHFGYTYISTHDNGFRLRPDGTNYEIVYHHMKEVEKIDESKYPNLSLFTKLARPEVSWGTLFYAENIETSPIWTTKPSKPEGVSAVAGDRFITVSWNHTRFEDARGFRVYRSTDGMSYTKTIDLDYYTMNEIRDTGVTPGQAYWYKVSYLNLAGEGPLSDPVMCIAEAGTDQLPEEWKVANLNTAVKATATYSPAQHGSFYLDGGGHEIYGTEDKHSFLYTEADGDLDFSGRLVQFGGSFYKLGIMVREELNGSSRQFSITLGETGARYLRVFCRQSPGGGTPYVTGNEFTYIPMWMRITREGNTFKAYQSRDGINWVNVGQYTVSMKSKVYVGTFVCCKNDQATVRGNVKFDNVRLMDKNHQPVSAPTQFTAEAKNSTRVALSWTPVEGAESYTLLRKDPTIGGSINLVSDLITTPSFTDSLRTAETTYDYFLLSRNKTGLSADTAKISITMPSVGLPLAPENFRSAQVDTKNIRLSWNIVDEAASYVIKRKEEGTDEYVQLAEISTSKPDNIYTYGTKFFYEDITVDLEKSYSYKLLAKNDLGESNPADVNANVKKTVMLPGSKVNSADAVTYGLARLYRGQANFAKVTPKEDLSYQLEGAVFETATKEDFSDAVVIGTIEGVLKSKTPVGIPLNVVDNKFRRYFRLTTPDGLPADAADIKYYGDTVCLKDQVITFNLLPGKTINDDDFAPNAVASSGLPCTYTSSNEAVAVITDEGLIHIVGIGTANIYANQIGDDEWGTAIQKTQRLTVSAGTGLDSISIEPVGTEAIYNIQGQQIPELQKGFNIVCLRMSDGSIKVEKVFVK